MVARDAEADFAVRFEAACRGEEAEARRAEGIAGGQGYAAVVDSVGVGGGWWGAGEGEVPVVEVVVGCWGGVEVGGRGFGEFLGFFH